MARWNTFEHKLYRELRAQLKLEKPSRIAVLVSGGRDSMSLLHALSALRSALKLPLEVIHFHHGTSEDERQSKFRDEASNIVRHYCEQFGLPQSTHAHVGPILRSEASMRLWRRSILQRYESEGVKLITAHHADDLLETRLMRLIRGSGFSGLSAMQKWGRVWRPWIDLSAADVKQYAALQGIKWLEDPSNASSHYFRNWVRGEWLPMLERRQPGAVFRLSGSLQQLVDQFQDQIAGQALAGASGEWALSTLRQDQALVFGRDVFKTLRFEQKKQHIHRCLKQLNAEYSKNHILEIIKRLDTVQRRLMFEVTRTRWTIGPSHIQVESLP